MSLSPKELQDLLDEIKASWASRKRAWENLQEIRWVLKDAAGVELPPPRRKIIDLEARIVKDGVRKTLTERQVAVSELVKAISEFRKFTDQPLTLRGGDYARSSRLCLHLGCCLLEPLGLNQTAPEPKLGDLLVALRTKLDANSQGAAA